MDAGAAKAAAELAMRERARERARAIAFKHRKAAREARIYAGSWAHSSFVKPKGEALAKKDWDGPRGATAIQAAYRGLRGRRRVRREHRAATEIQKVRAGFLN